MYLFPKLRKMVLNEECKGALKYDYVIGTSEDMLKTGQYTKVLKIRKN